MNLTLEAQMDRLFVHGLRTMQHHKLQIKKKWRHFYNYLHSSGRKSAPTMELAIDILTEHLFHTQFAFDEESLLLQIKHDWQDKIGSVDSNAFVLSMLESTVHRSIEHKENGKDTQSIQFVFSKINDYVLSDVSKELFTIESFIKDLINSQQLSFQWIATIIEKDEQLSLEQWFDSQKSSKKPIDRYTGETLYILTEKILQNIKGHNEKNYLFSLPYEQKIILFCTRDSNVSELQKYISYMLQRLKNGKQTLQNIRYQDQWKDPVVLFQDSLMKVNTFHEALKTITEGFVHYLPFERSAIFSYSKDDVGMGLSGIRFDRKEIQAITEDVRNLPLIDRGLDLLRIFGKGMRFLQPLYIRDAKDSFPEAYIEQFQLKSIVVAPIFNSANNELLGAVFLDQGENRHFTISEDTYTALIKFGQSAGSILGKFTDHIDTYNPSIRFSPRELEVLQLMANGESTTSAAEAIQLSEYTVRDYITSIMQKMKAKNRTEAVARAIRKGII